MLVAACGLAALAAPVLSHAQSLRPRWDVRIWPGSAMMVQSADVDGSRLALQSVRCINGDSAIRHKVYLQGGQPRVPGARRCGMNCAGELQDMGLGLRDPAGVQERMSTLSAVRRQLVDQAREETAADPWLNAKADGQSMLTALARACHLGDPMSPGDGLWTAIATSAFVIPPQSAAKAAPPFTHALATGAAPVLITKPTRPAAITEPLVVKAVVRADKGSIAVWLLDASAAKPPPPALINDRDLKVTLYFDLTPAMGPTSLVARNTDAAGPPARITVFSVEYMPRAKFDRDAAADLAGAMRAQVKPPRMAPSSTLGAKP